MVSAVSKPATGHVRWLIVFLTFAIAAVAYLDRANISIAAPFIKRDFALNNYQLGFVFSAFVFGYALAQPFAGRLADRFGAFRTIAVGICLWCVLTAATALIPADFAQAFAVLLLVRLALGLGESMIFPASNRLVSNWIPSAERGLANGIIFAGVGIGAGLAPPLITTIMIDFNWRYAFWASAVIGVAALAVWLLLADETPRAHRWVKPAELSLIQAGLPRKSETAARAVLPWGAIILNRQIALLTLSYTCFGYVAYIFFTWFFTYLSTVRSLDLRASGIYGMLPFIAMAIASPLGGWVSDGLAARFGKRIGRCLLAALTMTLAAGFLVLAMSVDDARLAAVVLAGGSGALYLAQSAFWTLSADMGRASAGSVSGVMNMGCQLGGALVAVATPVIADRWGWSSPFLFTAAVSLLGALAWLLIDPGFRFEET
ncbi:MAG TPA: MFS transporter [Rhizomicrobium sp.]|nr:MFS transporter [Rhizomicrobium sp.]